LAPCPIPSLGPMPAARWATRKAKIQDGVLHAAGDGGSLRPGDISPVPSKEPPKVGQPSLPDGPGTVSIAAIATARDAALRPRPGSTLRQGLALLPGFRVSRKTSGQRGEVEFVPNIGTAAGGAREEVLVRFGDDPEDLASLAWVPSRELQVLDASTGRATERADVQAYRHALQAIDLAKGGLSAAEIAAKLGRAEAWVRQKVAVGDASKLQKPRGLEWWDPEGFCDVTYLRRYAQEVGLYEQIVQDIDWEQDKVWRVRKDEGSSDWHLRTVKECPGFPGKGFCGRSLQKVPDSTHQIGPQDRRQANRTRPHADWACQLAGSVTTKCLKLARAGPIVEPYWWCPRCQWYACDACVEAMPDKATSKQVAHWQPGECPCLDALVLDMARDFCLPNPLQSNYTVKMNWYPDALSRVSPHRHDNWTLLLSLGAPRVLTVDRARVLMEDGDVILFGTQSHGVPEMPSCLGGRLSLVFMFAPNIAVGEAAGARAAARPEARSRRGCEARACGEPSCGIEEALEASVRALCDLGFLAEEAAVALRATDGDVEQAAALLFAEAS